MQDEEQPPALPSRPTLAARTAGLPLQVYQDTSNQCVECTSVACTYYELAVNALLAVTALKLWDINATITLYTGSGLPECVPMSQAATWQLVTSTK